jgi:hypothetical protein
MNRLTALLFVTLVLTGCERQHRLTWPGVDIRGTSSDSNRRAVTYGRAYWSLSTYEGTPTPQFSIRTPDGGLLTPDSMTIEIMDAHGATEKFYGRGTGRNFDYGNGWMTALFDSVGRLESVSVVLSKTLRYEDPRRTIYIGSREGTLWVSFPAKRDDLIELFGEPKKEWDYIPRWH